MLYPLKDFVVLVRLDWPKLRVRNQQQILVLDHLHTSVPDFIGDELGVNKGLVLEWPPEGPGALSMALGRLRLLPGIKLLFAEESVDVWPVEDSPILECSWQITEDLANKGLNSTIELYPH